jgi:hypothetical protein
MDILQDGMRRLHKNLEPPTPENYPAEYHQLIITQNQIGWQHLYKGRWSSQWAKLQDDYCASTTTAQGIIGTQWVLNMGRLLIDQWLKVWEQRNADRHSKDKILNETIHIQALQSQLHELYTYKTQVCPADASLFYTSSTEHITNHTWTAIEDWINIYKEAIIASAQQATQLGIQGNRTITEYPMFNPTVIPRQQVSLTADSLPG